MDNKGEISGLLVIYIFIHFTHSCTSLYTSECLLRVRTSINSERTRWAKLSLSSLHGAEQEANIYMLNSSSPNMLISLPEFLSFSLKLVVFYKGNVTLLREKYNPHLHYWHEFRSLMVPHWWSWNKSVHMPCWGKGNLVQLPSKELWQQSTELHTHLTLWPSKPTLGKIALK